MRRTRLLVPLLAAVAAASGLQAQAQRPWPHAAVAGHPYDEAQPPSAPQELWVVVEIPQGSAIKYEVDKTTGRVYVDRFQSMPVHAPANYGSIPSTLAADGDPLDAVVFARAPLHPGVFVKVRPIGLMKTMDGTLVDDKVLAVPVSAVDPTYDGITEASALPTLELDRVAAYFRVYKQLPGGQEGKLIEVSGAAAARDAVAESTARYRSARPSPSAPTSP
ncbi:MAG TPA: inorganic diphosphatase [Vicinamibacteria bacterium]|nr:inorganic diphosphatase [Vicinamibacteria bacterium]